MILEVIPEHGGYIAVPINKYWRKKYASHMKEMTGNADSSVYFQGEYDLPEEITQHREYNELMKGWTIHLRIDPWIYGHWLGYDAYRVS